MIISDRAVKYILLQRSQYFTLGKKYPILYRLLPLLVLVKIESFLFGNKIKRLYSADMENEFSIIKPFIASHTNSILDVGCGVAGVDLFLYQHTKAEIFLLDKSEIESTIHYGFQKTGSFYNSLQTARLLLEKNGVPKNKIHTQEATENFDINYPASSLDLVISLISWGFHYPISTYLKNVYSALKQDGLLIIDVRKYSGGENELADFFNLKMIYDTKSYFRYVCEKKKI